MANSKQIVITLPAGKESWAASFMAEAFKTAHELHRARADDDSWSDGNRAANAELSDLFMEAFSEAKRVEFLPSTPQIAG